MSVSVDTHLTGREKASAKEKIYTSRRDRDPGMGPNGTTLGENTLALVSHREYKRLLKEMEVSSAHIVLIEI